MSLKVFVVEAFNLVVLAMGLVVLSPIFLMNWIISNKRNP